MTWQHGTPTGYRANGCRCDPCKAAHRDRRQQERIRHEADRKHCRCATCVHRRRVLRVADQEATSAENRAAFLADLTDPRHGRSWTAARYGCRCAACVDARNAAHRLGTSRRRKIGLQPGDHRHGTDYGYTAWGCHCQPCRDAHNAYRRQLRERIAS